MPLPARTRNLEEETISLSLSEDDLDFSWNFNNKLQEIVFIIYSTSNAAVENLS